MADIPGVWDYIYKNPFDYGQSFTQGLHAGAGARKSMDDREAEAARLAQQKVRDESIDSRERDRIQQSKDQFDRTLKDREQARADQLLEKFGSSVVHGPDGSIDVPASVLQTQQRMENDRKAEALGRMEIRTGIRGGPEYDYLRDSPGYNFGRADEFSKKANQDAITARSDEANKARLEAARIRALGKRGEGEKDELEVIDGATFIRSPDGSLREISKETAREILRHKSIKKNVVPDIIVRKNAKGEWEKQNPPK